MRSRMAQTLYVAHLRALLGCFAVFLHERQELTTKDTKDTKKFGGGASCDLRSERLHNCAMKNMLRQPTSHRAWREFLCNRALRAMADASQPAGAFRVGIIGAGRVARRHLYGYRKTGKAVVVAIADRSEEHTSELQSRFGISY